MDKEPPQTDAIEDEPFDSVISDTNANCVWEISCGGRTACNARHANLPWPISRRPGPTVRPLHQQNTEGSYSAAGSSNGYMPSTRRSSARRRQYPSGHNTDACVSPRVNKAEPCVRGRSRFRNDRTNCDRSRPSIRLPVFTMSPRTTRIQASSTHDQVRIFACSSDKRL